MDGQSLSQALVKLSGDDLRLVYALLCKTNILNLITTKTKDLLSSKESNHFSKHLEEEARKLRGKTDEELRLLLFLELTKIAKLKGDRYDTPKEIVDKCQEIVDWAFLQFQKKHKDFQPYYQKNEFTKLEAMINWQMNQIFKEMDLKLRKLTQKEQDDFAAKVMLYVNSLPRDQKEKIKEKLGVQELTDTVVKRVITQSGASFLFATIVEASGFAFYTTATSALAGFSGLIGVTLPFGAYTGLGSMIAFLANPLIMLPLLLGGGVLMVNHQNKSLRKRLVPIVLMQITLPYYTDPVLGHYDLDLITNEWIPRMKEYEQLQQELQTTEEEQKILQEKIRFLNAKLQTKDMEKKKRESAISTLKGNIKVQLINDKGRPNFDRLTDDLDMYRKEIILIERKMVNEKNAATGLWGSIKTSLKTSSYQSEITELRKKIDSIYDDMVKKVVLGRVTYAQDYVRQMGELQWEVNELHEEITSLKIHLDKQNKELTNLKTTAQTTRAKMKEKESETYGLEHAALEAESLV
nr:hypothetical protein [Neobacillus sp. Marseille-Q6967]